jgi:signal transduction histidine kinase
MNQAPHEISAAELQEHRRRLRRGLRRATLASAVLLFIVVGLAMAVTWKAAQTERAAEQARAATYQAEEELWKARLSQARARRIAGGPGARTESSAIIRDLVQRPALSQEQTLSLRTEAIAQLALPDLLPGTNSVTVRGHGPWDGAFTRYAQHSSSNTVRVRDFQTHRVLAEFRHPSNALPQFTCLTPDGRLVITRFSGSDVFAWELNTGRVVLKTRCPRRAETTHPLFVSPDSQMLAMFTANGLVLQELASNSPPRPLHPGRDIYMATFTSDRRHIAVVEDKDLNTVEVWRTDNGQVVQRFSAGFELWNIEWHPDGRRMILAGDFGKLTLWDVPLDGLDSSLRVPREVMPFTGHIGAILSTGFSPDGSMLVSESWDGINGVWDVVSGRRLLAAPGLRVRQFNTAGDALLTRSPDNTREHLTAFLRRTGYRVVGYAGEPRAAHGAWFSPDGRYVIVANAGSPSQAGGECHLWDFERATRVARFPGMWAQFHPDGKSLVVCSEGALHQHSLTPELLTGQSTSTPTVLLPRSRNFQANAVLLSPDQKTFVVAGTHGVALLDIATGQVRVRLNVPAHVASLSPDGALLATMFQNQPGRLLNPTNGSVLFEQSGIVDYIFSPDGRWIAGYSPANVHLIERATLRTVREITVAKPGGRPMTVAFNHDSTLLAVTHERFEVRLLEVPTGAELATFAPPNPAAVAGMRGLHFSGDGRWLLMVKEDGETAAWELPAVRRELAQLGLDWANGSPTYSPTPKPGPAKWQVSTPHIALAASLIAALAGIFLVLQQQNMIAGYDRVERVALEQWEKLKTAQRELLHSQKMRALGTLAAGVAHDFNNLLSVIRLSNQLAAEQTKPTGAAKENMDAIESAVAQGEAIVQSMLGYSRGTNEQSTAYSVAEAVSETVAMLGKKFLAGIVLQLEIAPELPPVVGARARLEQILLNLVVNASEAMNGRGRLGIRCLCAHEARDCILPPNEAGQFVVIAVSDSGPGIPPEVLSRIFEPFFTTKTSGTRPGTGLGLSTVYTMAEQDGLGLAVHTSPNGTTFRIFVPVNTALGEVRAGERNSPTASAASAT